MIHNIWFCSTVAELVHQFKKKNQKIKFNKSSMIIIIRNGFQIFNQNLESLLAFGFLHIKERLIIFAWNNFYTTHAYKSLNQSALLLTCSIHYSGLLHMLNMYYSYGCWSGIWWGCSKFKSRSNHIYVALLPTHNIRYNFYCMLSKWNTRKRNQCN